MRVIEESISGAEIDLVYSVVDDVIKFRWLNVDYTVEYPLQTENFSLREIRLRSGRVNDSYRNYTISFDCRFSDWTDTVCSVHYLYNSIDLEGCYSVDFYLTIKVGECDLKSNMPLSFVEKNNITSRAIRKVYASSKAMEFIKYVYLDEILKCFRFSEIEYIRFDQGIRIDTNTSYIMLKNAVYFSNIGNRINKCYKAERKGYQYYVVLWGSSERELSVAYKLIIKDCILVWSTTTNLDITVVSKRLL